MTGTRSSRTSERGQLIVIGAFLLPMLLGIVGFSIDVGAYSTDRRTLQNAADSIAMAAARDLCTPTPTDCSNTYDASTTAYAYARQNGVDPNDVHLTFTGGNEAPQVKVTITRSHRFFFINALGLQQKPVGATATAAKVSFGGYNGIVPWGVTQATVSAAGNGSTITLKYDSTGANAGNFGAIRIDGSGAATYVNDVMYGSSSYVCAATAPHCTTGSCPGQYPNVCAETSPTCNGPDCDPEPGNMTGPTRNGVDFRMNNTSTACDSFAKAFGSADASGQYHLASVCNPWLPGNGCTNTATRCSRRVLIVPVIDGFGNGASTPDTIQRFALVYLEGYAGTCTGNSCDVLGRFVRADLTTGALAGTYDANAQIHFIKLVE